MHPELFTIPGTHLTVYTYGAFMVVGFISAIFVIRRLSRNITPDAQLITNAALYALIAGVVGSRIFYVIHYFDSYRGQLWKVFAVWEGGLELLGGVIPAIIVIYFFLRYHKLPVRQYMDILAIGLMAALISGRAGCIMRGCCFGKPTEVPWAIRFPYGSPAFHSQINPDSARDRPEPYLNLPDEYFGFVGADGLLYGGLKPLDQLTDEQRHAVTKGEYRCLRIHPTQLYASGGSALICLMLYGFWKRARKAAKAGAGGLLTAPGTIFALMLVFYGMIRIVLEWLRDDNPFEFARITIAQITSIPLIVLGLILVIAAHIFEAHQAKSGKKP